MRRLVMVLLLGVASCSDSSSSPTSSTNGTGLTQVMSACLNVCACFTRATEINDCRSDCNRMAVGARLKTNRAFSGGSASFTTSTFWSSGSQASHMASSACLTCLASASCSALTGGTACLGDCASLAPVGSGI